MTSSRTKCCPGNSACKALLLQLQLGHEGSRQGSYLTTHSAVAEVAVIMGSDSDLRTMRSAAEVLKDMGIACEVTVVSAHRTPDRLMEFARAAHKRGIKVSA